MKSSSSHFVHLTYIAAQPLGPRDSYRYVSTTPSFAGRIGCRAALPRAARCAATWPRATAASAEATLWEAVKPLPLCTLTRDSYSARRAFTGSPTAALQAGRALAAAPITSSNTPALTYVTGSVPRISYRTLAISLDSSSAATTLTARPTHSGTIAPRRITATTLRGVAPSRSEERRVGKECRSRWSP